MTGATNGVGLGTARALTRAGAHVIMAVRNTELGAQRAKEIGGSTSIVEGRPRRPVVGAGFRRCARRRRRHPDQQRGRADQQREETVDGFEMTLGTNLLGPFALTNLLFAGCARRSSTSDRDAHRAAELRLDDMHLRTGKWTSMGAYARSKLAVMLWGLELDRRLRAANSPVVSQLTHPGWVASNMSQLSDKPLLAAADKVVRRWPTVGQRHRRRRRVDAVLHQRTDPAGQLCRLDGPFGLSGPR